MNKLTFKSKGFYQPVIDRLESYGMKFMAWVTVNNKMVPFHVSALAAQDSRLFFELPGKSMILMLGYTEQYTNDIFQTKIEDDLGYWGYWHGELYIKFDEFKLERDLLMKLREVNQFADFEDVKRPNVRSGFDGGKNFTAYGNNFDDANSESFDIMEAIKAFSWIIETFGPYMYHRFNQLNASFAPEYAFPGCNKIFWNNFPFDRLRSKVLGNIIGCN